MYNQRKRYYYGNVFSTSKGILNVLKALEKKYKRDYISFFTSLSEQYVKGPANDLANEGIKSTTKLLGHIDTAIKTNQLSKETEQQITDLSNEIEDIKNGLIEQSKTNKALEDRFNKIEKTTGLTPEDLNVTQEIIQSGISQLKQQVEPSFLERVSQGLPNISRGVSNIRKEIITSLTGPFSEFINPLIEDLGNFARNEKSFERKKQEGRILSQINPSQVNIPLGPIKKKQDRVTIPGTQNQVGTKVNRKKTLSRKDLVEPFVLFYDREAYDAKWTRELLDSIKKISGDGVSSLGGAISGFLGKDGFFGKLGSSILPLIGVGGKFALLAAATTLLYKNTQGVIEETKKLRTTSKDLVDSVKRTARIGNIPDRGKRLREEISEAGGLQKYSEQTGKTIDEITKSVANADIAKTLQENSKFDSEKSKWNFLAGPLLGSILTFRDLKKSIYRNSGVPSSKEYNNLVNKTGKELSRIGSEQDRAEMEALNQRLMKADSWGEIQEILKSIDTELKKQQTTGPMIRNEHDSGDTLLQSLSGGNLGLNE